METEVMAVRLRDLREDNDYTQAFVADYLCIKQNTYSQYENELRQIPIGSLIKLSVLYNTSIDYIVGITDNPEKYK